MCGFPCFYRKNKVFWLFQGISDHTHRFLFVQLPEHFFSLTKRGMIERKKRSNDAKPHVGKFWMENCGCILKG